MKLTSNDFIRRYQMSEHPEGGFYKETWRSSDIIPSQGIGDFKTETFRNLMTSILFLLPGNTFSALHRIRSEELWNYHYGDPVVVFEIINGEWKETVLGTEEGQVLQYVVKPGIWFGSRCLNPDGFGLVGCTVVPGFDFSDFEMAGFELLKSQYPQLQSQIGEFTRLP